MSDVPFHPTHRLRTDAAAWQEPRPDSPPAPRLDNGLPVELMGRLGGWAQVRCANGWTTWIDARVLEANEPPVVSHVAVPPLVRPRSRSRAPVFVAIGVVAAVAVAAAVLLTRGGGDGTSTATSVVATNVAPASSVQLDVPAGWAVSPDGLTAAANPDDLGAAIAIGPRVIARVGADPDTLAALRDAMTAPYTIVAEPEKVTVGGADAVAVTLQWTWNQVDANGQAAPVDYVFRYIAVEGPDGQGVLFELSAPAAQWDAVASTLAQVPSLG